MSRHQETDTQMLFVFFFMNLCLKFESRPNVHPFIINPVLKTQKLCKLLVVIFVLFWKLLLEVRVKILNVV